MYCIVMGVLLPLLSFSQRQMMNDADVLSAVKLEMGNQMTQKELNAFQLKVNRSTKSSKSNIEHYYFLQTLNGIEIQGTESSIHLKQDGSVLKFNNKLEQDIARQSNLNVSSSINPIEAIQAANKHLGFSSPGQLEVLEHSSLINRAQKVSKGNVSRRDIPVKLVYHKFDNGELALAWDLSIYETEQEEWWSIRVDANSGEILDQVSWMVHCNFSDSEAVHSCADHYAKTKSLEIAPAEIEEKTGFVGGYRVYAMPTKHAGVGNRTLVTDPDNALASPYGWHDTNGAPGAEFTTTQGNNAHAYDNGNNAGYSANGGNGLLFDFPLDLTQDPELYEDAGLTNLFYWSNIAHDVLYQYGFDEASGNFQENNYGKGGIGGDYVYARFQSGTVCNATMGTPADGSNPSMTNYVCSGRDGALSNSIILHEYAHGLSNRLTGGPASANCLRNAEQMGEGWSDYIGLMLTMQAGDVGATPNPIGEWFLNPNGIRPYPYSTDMTVNPHTYANSFSGTSQPHGIGSVWCVMLWDMTWDLINQYGFDANFYTGTGGNNIALQLVVEGMKLQPCNPGFVDGRDAILAADQALYGGANQCLIWAAFAKRGLGKNASQGSSADRSDGNEAFNIPISCGGTECELTIGSSTSYTDYFAASNQSISVISSGAWTASTTSNWITVTSSSGNGNGTVTFNVSENLNSVSRTATIEITCQSYTATFSVTQGPAPCVQSYNSIPYSTGFESGSTDANWCLESSEFDGRIEISSSRSPRGNFHLLMDMAVDGTFNTNQARLGLDLAGKNTVALTFWWKEFSDETHVEDGVFISDDGGANYTKIYDLSEGTTTYQKVFLNLTQFAIDNGLNLTSTFIVKFQQYDNYSAPSDGISIDDITVTEISCNIGQSCDDGDPCTINDVILPSCACRGTFEDSDSDGVCDANDQCPGQDDILDLNQNGTPDCLEVNCTCTGTITTFPHTEDFEIGLGDICQNNSDNFDWTISSGVTGSLETGPLGAYQGSNYFYTESSAPNIPTKFASFHSGCYDLSGKNQASINFWYHMYGVAMGTLDLDVSTDDGITWTSVWSLTGDQGNSWKNANVDISNYTGGSMIYRFTGTTDDSWTSDMALDVITVDVAGGPGCTPGASCDDNDVCTTGDVYDANCNCAGTFQDADNDGVCDANDQCPGTDDAIIGTSCDDNDVCTINDVYNTSCNCVGTFQDTDNDGVCDANDQCPGTDDAIIGTSCNDNDVCTINDVYDTSCNCVGTFQDTDNDTVCDADDQCPGFDDRIDLNGNGIPDACETSCVNTTTNFPTSSLSHSGSGSSSTTLSFPSGTEEVSFTISGLNSRTRGKKSNRFVDVVTVSYLDGNGNTVTQGTYSGANTSTVNISITTDVQSVTVALSNGQNTNVTVNVNIGTVTYCAPAANAVRLTSAVDVKAYPVPFENNLNIELSLPGYETSNGQLTVYDVAGRMIYSEEVSWSNRLETSFNTSNWNAGVYYIYYVDSNYKTVKKVLSIK